MSHLIISLMDKTMLFLNIIVGLLIAEGNTFVIQTITNPLRVQNQEFKNRCNPGQAATEVNAIDEIRILRRYTGQTVFEAVANVRRASQPTILSEDLRNRGAQVDGGASDLNGSFLQYNVPASRTDCRDAAEYMCIIYYNRNVSNAFALTTVSPSVVPPTQIPRITYVSPSNVPRTSDRDVYQYTFNTTVAFTCTVEAGNPPGNIHWCIQPNANAGFFRPPMTGMNTDSKSSEASKSCYINRTSTWWYRISASVSSPKVRCIFNPNTECSGSNFVDVQIQGQEFPVCPTTTTTTKSDLTFLTNTDQQYSSVGTTFLILGCILMFLALIVFIGSVLTFLRARHKAKEIEKNQIRMTYDSVRMNENSDTSYSSIESIRRHAPVSRQDSDGYIVPSVVMN